MWEQKKFEKIQETEETNPYVGLVESYPFLEKVDRKTVALAKTSQQKNPHK